MYVDDLLTGADSLEEIREIRDEIIGLLRLGGFDIRQWLSNHRHALDSMDTKILDLDCALENESVSKTLGVIWDSREDKFSYSVKQIQIPEKITKRHILSEIAKIFDPPGILGPVILYAKIIMQDCWKIKCDWDESVPQELFSRWINFTNQLNHMHNFAIERKVIIDKHISIEAHGFCDASQNGYGACLYFRSTDENGNVAVRLVCAKSKVAPLKTKTIPQLELCGALALVRLYKDLRPALQFEFNRIVFWSDSTIVLHWIQKSPEVLRVFEANRVAEIQAVKTESEWRHVRTQDNPADALSRGQLPAEFVKNSIWLKGPPWLSMPENEWPNNIIETPKILPGLKTKTCLAVNTKIDFYLRFSSFTTLIKVVAFCLRMRPSNIYRSCKQIGVEEKLEAERVVFRVIQREQFAEEILRLSSSQGVKSTRLAAFDPFLDEHGLLRVGGRLRYADIPFDQRYPILLPSRHHVTDLLIRETHTRNFHAGIQTTLYTMRQRFWLLDGKNQVRSIVRKCIECIRHRPPSLFNKMGNLPQARVEPTSAFSHVGVDFFGLMYIKEKRLRNRNKVKAYGCVYVCMASKAVHLEIVSDLSTEGFLASFRRFISRRGIPSHVYSDNGSNFVGAANELKELYALFNSDKHCNTVNREAVSRNIKWHFNPPLSPHFGGIWESAVKSFKHHFKRVIGNQLLAFEEINTVAIEIEAILNSRPLYAISTDPNDPIAITPAHLLIGRPINLLPEDDFLSVAGNRLSIGQRLAQARQDFWRRWNVEYLSELQRRQKWLKSTPNLARNSVVLVIDKNQPCGRWQLGLVQEIHPGDDGVVRVVTVKTTQGLYKRNITQLCPLPLASEEKS